ncbi:phage integrase SAM-like domain-containing protein [Prosthecochloris sp. CIB 2401]|uniref:phage integrase SAM-like domain-containing protein n=1 Tax=Prosthecochloris sp. CIB 2401 TaxID=1868325 RepID=UPI00080AA40A|nr:hypothetical protein Ptc2401_00877 [Prosthecochloris sp. CIB 2401]
MQFCNDLDHHWLESFQEFLLNAYSQNTARTYSTKIRQVITKDQKDGYLTDNPNRLFCAFFFFFEKNISKMDEVL